MICKFIRFLKNMIESLKIEETANGNNETSYKEPIKYWTPAAIANIMIIRASAENKTISNLNLQRLVILAHGFYLAFKGRPLCSEKITGKMLEIHEMHFFPSLRKECARFGCDSVSYLYGHDTPEMETDEWKIPSAVYSTFKNYDHGQLLDILRPIKCAGRNFIPDSEIEEYFKTLLKK